MRRGHIYERLYENTEYNIRARYSQQKPRVEVPVARVFTINISLYTYRLLV